LLEGGLLPIISLTSLHFFVKYEKPEDIGLTRNEKDFKLEPKNSVEDILKDIEGPLPKDFKHPLGQEHPEDVYVPHNKKEKLDVDDILPNKVDDSINVEISERMDNRVDGYIGDEEELKTVVEESVEDTENEILEKEVVNRKVVKQPIKPPKSKINRIN